MMNQATYRDSHVKWTMTNSEVGDVLSRRGRGMRVSLVGKHGFGKSTILEYVAKYDREVLVVEGDQLLQFTYNLETNRPTSERLCDSPKVWDWADKGSGRYAQLERCALKRGLLDNVDLFTNFGDYAYQTWMVQPDHAFYQKNLKARTAAMLKEKQWSGYTADHWPVLSFKEFCDWVENKWSEGRIRGAVPNLGRSSDILWKQWWDHLKAEYDRGYSHLNEVLVDPKEGAVRLVFTRDSQHFAVVKFFNPKDLKRHTVKFWTGDYQKTKDSWNTNTAYTPTPELVAAAKALLFRLW